MNDFNHAVQMKFEKPSRAIKPSSREEPVRLGRRFTYNELVMKIDELEKLFADRNRAPPTDRSNTCTAPGMDRTARFLPDGELLTIPAFDRDWNSRIASFSGGLRGKYYNRYMEKRDSKIREEWRTRGNEKAMELKALQDRFDRISAEIRVKLFRPDEMYKSRSEARCRVEKLRSFNSRSSTTLCIQQGQGIDSTCNEEEKEEEHKLSGPKLYQNTGFIDRGSVSSAPQSPVIPVPRPSLRKSSDFSSGRRRGQIECSGDSETKIRSQRASVTRTKSDREDFKLRTSSASNFQSLSFRKARV